MRAPRCAHALWLALVVGCGARSNLFGGDLEAFTAPGTSGAFSISGAAGAQASQTSGAAGAAIGSAGAATSGSGGALNVAGQPASSGGATTVCLHPDLLSVAPPNARTGIAASDAVRAIFSCPPDPSISRADSLRVAGRFAGALPGTFPAPALPNEIFLQPLPPDTTRKLPYFPGELVTGWVGEALGGPYQWQFTAAVRAKAAVKFTDTGENLEHAMEVELADLDHDGDLDLVTGFATTNTGRVYSNDGKGNFTLRASLTGVREPFLADVDGDGQLDIISDHLFLNGGGFDFVDAGALGQVQAVFDADGDGDRDIFLVQGQQQWALLVNDGTGQFKPRLMAEAYLFDTQVADLDNDGDLDLVSIALVSGTPSQYRGAVLLNDGEGNFTEIVSGLMVDATRALALGDVDRDGDVDVFMASWGAAGAINPADQVWLNDGKAHFTAGDAPLSGSPHIVLSDLDGDGDLDAIAGQHAPYSNYKGDPSQVLLNDGTGHFSVSGSVGGSNFQHVVLGDLDGDGDLDAVIAQWDWTLKPPVQVWLQDG